MVEGRLPLLVNVDQASDIDAVLRLARATNVKVIVAGGAEAWKVADKLAAANVPVIVGPMVNIPRSFSTLGSRQETPCLLQRAGVKMVLIGNGERRGGVQRPQPEVRRGRRRGVRSRVGRRASRDHADSGGDARRGRTASAHSSRS